MQENELAIQLVISFPSLITERGVDTYAAFRIMDELGIEDKIDMLQKLEAVFRGIRGREQR